MWWWWWLRGDNGDTWTYLGAGGLPHGGLGHHLSLGPHSQVGQDGRGTTLAGRPQGADEETPAHGVGDDGAVLGQEGDTG